jgi:UDP-N-acetylglucosamine 2-epimerase (non-hydrolysing)
MSAVFFDDLGMPEPHYNLEVGSASHANQTAKIMIKFEELITRDKPDMVIVVGDVNSTIAVALCAVKHGIIIAHVEAGLRSFDMSMPEEINRILTDRISNLLLASEPSGVENLLNEGCDKSHIHLIGNVMIDSLQYNLPNIDASSILDDLVVKANNYVVITIHRPSNVDTPEKLQKIIKILRFVAQESPLVFPMHPRTRQSLNAHNMEREIHRIENLNIIEPQGYNDFMKLVKDSRYVITDSGGLQEESTWLGIPCITLRPNTERPITVTHGTNKLSALNVEQLKELIAWAKSFDRESYAPPALWDGHAAERIIDVISNYLGLDII